MKKILSLCLTMTLLSIVILANEPPPIPTPKPDSKKSIDTNLTIKIDKNAKVASLIIPKSQIKQLRAELEQLDNEQDTNASATTGFTRTQTMVSGLFMSLAMIFGGIWWTRQRKFNTKTGKALAAGAVLFCIGSMATIAFGNAGPPPELRQITGKLFDKKVFGYFNSAYGKIKIQLKENDNGVELVVPAAQDTGKNGEE